MRFNKFDINNQPLQSYLLNNCMPVAHKQVRGSLVAVYESEEVVKSIQAKIKRYKDDNRYNKHVPLWENHLNVLNILEGGE